MISGCLGEALTHKARCGAITEVTAFRASKDSSQNVFQINYLGEGGRC